MCENGKGQHAAQLHVSLMMTMMMMMWLILLLVL